MNQEKIGKFIAELRNEKQMTQQELADKIGVTDRAISKWENARGMPDLSLIRPLCYELGITINELLSGERINEKDYKTKFEDNVLKTIDYSNEKINNTKRSTIIVLGIIGMVVLITGTMFFVDVNRMNNNKPVVFSTWGFKYAPLPVLESFIRTYYVLAIAGSNDERYIYLTIRQFQDEEVQTIKVEKKLCPNIEENKFYEFTIKPNKNIQDNYLSIFENSEILEIKETDKMDLEQIQEPIPRK